jgi:predicted RNA-binding protein with PIN domain
MAEHLIVDAFNLLHAARRNPRFRHFEDVKAAVFVLEDYCFRKDKRMTLVFDGTRFRDEITGSEAIEAIFSEPGESADAVAERLMNLIPKENRLSVSMITDDAELRSMARGMGLRTFGTEQLLRDVDACVKGKGSDAPPRTRPQKPFNNPFSDKL